MTVHRQQQLKKLLSKYDGVSIPIAHFRKDHRSNHKLRNAEAYPVVKALEYDILERTNDFLRLRDGMILGEKDLP